MNNLIKNYFRFTAITGLYGFTRGYRVNDSVASPMVLSGNKFLYGISNGVYYMILPYQINGMYNLGKRIYVKINKLDMYNSNYIDSYEEIGGYCLDTI